MFFKKMVRYILPLGLILLLASCTMPLTIIEIDEDSIPPLIYLGEFDITDVQILITKNEQEPEIVPVTLTMINIDDYNKLSTVGMHEIKINYKNQSFTLNLEILPPRLETIARWLNDDVSGINLPSPMVDNYQLPLKGLHGSLITWDSNSEYLIVDEDGIVKLNQPHFSLGDQVAELEAQFSLYEEIIVCQYDTIVEAAPEIDQETLNLIASIADAIVLPPTISTSLDLPFASSELVGLKINWTSSDENIIFINNQLKRVAVNQDDFAHEVTLDYTIEYQGNIFTYPSIIITVLAEVPSSKAPGVSNVLLDDNLLSWTGPEGATEYLLSIDGFPQATISDTSVDLLSMIEASGQYTIYLQTIAFDNYLENSNEFELYYYYATDHLISYYDSINLDLVGEALKMELRALLQTTHTKTTSYDELRQMLQYTDQPLDNSDTVYLIYSEIKVKNTWDAGLTWNREHLWPQSLGWFKTTGAGSDLHHIRPADPSVNSSRGNNIYGKVIDGTQVKLSSRNGGTYINAYRTSKLFEPSDSTKGDVARIIFYLMTRYPESDIYGFTRVAESIELLLEWNRLDPVDAFEARRNERTASIQGNRNPFIDYSGLADQIWALGDE